MVTNGTAAVSQRTDAAPGDPGPVDNWAGPALGDDDVCKHLAAVGGGGLIEHAVLVEAEVDGVGRQAGIEADHHPGREVAAEGGGAVEDDGGPVFFGQLGQRLLSAGSHDQVIHLGQDEFAILSSHVDDAALHAARRVLQRVGIELRVEGERFALSASIGISQFPQDGDDGEILLLHARQAVTTARQAGGNSWARYCPEHTPVHQAREALENDLRLALGRPDEMHLHYQPIINFRTGQVVSMEALARWHHPRLGMVGPERFIPIAEESSLIIALGHRLLDTALRQWKTWQQAGLPAVPISVNLSARQLCKVDLHDDIAQLLARHQVPASMLQLEITETALAQAGLTPITRTLDALADMGICIALDDFGTGYANLQHLYRYRPDHIKIDRSFISHIGLDTHSELIVAALLGLSHNLQLGVVAEGVETLEQANWLWQHGCDVLQGFLFSRPLPAQDMALYLRSMPHTSALCPLPDAASDASGRRA